MPSEPRTAPPSRAKSGTIPVLTMLERDDDHAVGTWGPLVVVIWRKETTLAAVKRVGEMFARHGRAHGAALGSFMVVGEQAPLPSAAVRRAMVEVLHATKLSFSAVVFEGQGFRAAAVRGVVTGISLIAQPPFPHKAFATVEEAAMWASQVDRVVPIMPLAIVQAVSKLRNM